MSCLDTIHLYLHDTVHFGTGKDRKATPRPDGVLSLDNHLILPGPCWPGAGAGQPSSARYQQNIRQQPAAGISRAAQPAKKGISLWTETFSYDDWRRTHGCHKVLIQIRCLGNTTPWFYKATYLGRALGEFLNGPLEGSRKPCLKLHPWILQELFANFFASLLEFFMPGHGEAALQRRASEHCGEI